MFQIFRELNDLVDSLSKKGLNSQLGTLYYEEYKDGASNIGIFPLV